MNSFHDAFISYGRADSKAFALKLYQQLTKHGLSLWFDVETSPLAVDSQPKIEAGIEASDNFLFIISPQSINSPPCVKEIELALKRHKRIIPLLYLEHINRDTWQQRHPQGTDHDWEDYQAQGLHSSFTNMPPEISKSDWVYFRDGIDDFDEALAGLMSRLARYKDYVHRQTQLLAQALKWQQYQQKPSHLLTGKQSQRAKAWLQIKFKNEQPPCTPTDLHCAYITESLKHADNLMTQVFLVYAQEDIATMEKVRNSLRQEGITVGNYPSNNKTGEILENAIQQEIEQADNLLYLLSPEALSTGHCQRVINYARTLNKRIITVLVRETPSAQIPMTLRSLHYIDLTDSIKADDVPLENSQLIKVLLQDAAYYRQHKTLLVKALRWKQQQHNPSILLQGYPLYQASAWYKTANAHLQQSATDLQAEFIAASSRQPPARFFDVFIACDSTDEGLAQRLSDHLQTQGKTTWFEQGAIPVTVDRHQAMNQGIEISDNIVFLLSSDLSDLVNLRYAVDHAVALNKRIVVVQQQPDGTAIHPSLVDAETLTLDPDDFDRSFSQLIRILNTTRGHAHTHTTWSQRALEWQQNNKRSELLLRGNELVVAQTWLLESQSRNKRPVPTALQQEYIAASQATMNEAVQQEQQRLLRLKSLLAIVSAALVAAVGTSLFAFNQSQKAEKANLLALSDKSEALFSSDQGFEALLASVGAAGTLQKKRLLKQEPMVQAQIVTALLNAFYWEQEKNQLEGHQDTVQSVGFSPNGQLIATASDDGTLKMWNADGTLRFTLENHKDQVRDVAFSPDGERLASASADHTIKLWREDGVVLHTLAGHRGAVHSLSFSPDSQLIATGSDDRTIKLWHAKSGALVDTLTGHSAPVKDVVFSPDGKLIASISCDRKIKIWTATGIAVSSFFPSHTANLTAITWSPTGNRLISASEDHTMKLWTLEGKVVATFKGHTEGVQDVVFNPDGTLIASAGDDNTVRLWQPNGYLVNTLKSHRTTVTSVTFSPDGQTLASGSRDQSVKLWDLATPKTRTLGQHSSPVQAVEFSPDNQLLASVSGDRSIKLWTPGGQLRKTFNQAHPGSILALSFSPDSQSFATVGSQGNLKLWDSQKWIRQRTIAAHREAIHGVSISPDGNTLATASADKTVKLWHRSNGILKETFAGHTDTVYDVAWHPTGEFLASASGDTTIKIWKEDGVAFPPLRSHQAAVHGVAWSPDGQLLASASTDKTVKLWNQYGVLQSTFASHSDKVLDVQFAPNGKTLVSASADNTIKIWHLDGTEIATLKGHSNQVSSLNFQPNGRMLASADDNHQIILWNWQVLEATPVLDELLDQSCAWIEDYLKRQPQTAPEDSHVKTSCQTP